MGDGTILILGAGAAGLSAADCLSKAGEQVIIIEGRERAGGRIHTVQSSQGDFPIELGAEFIHGARVPTWDILRTANLSTHEVPGKFWEFDGKTIREVESFEEPISELLKALQPGAPDKTVETLFRETKSLDETSRRRAKAYVEGFHAAPVGKMSAWALARSEQAAEEEAGDQQFRVNLGYGALVDWYVRRLKKHEVTLAFGELITEIRWEPGYVEVVTQCHGRETIHKGARAVVTLPLGVLQARGLHAVKFIPELTAKKEAIDGLAMGPVIKITLQFRERFWPVENFGFLHIPAGRLPTWWTDPRGPILTAWAGDSQTAALAGKPTDAILSEACDELRRAFNVSATTLRDLLLSHFAHDWSSDPLSHGAYSFTPVGMMDMPEKLRESLEDTVYFAGEATDSSGQQGTVHGALASGQRAAEEILHVAAKT